MVIFHSYVKLPEGTIRYHSSQRLSFHDRWCRALFLTISVSHRIHAIYGVPRIPSIYPSHVSIPAPWIRYGLYKSPILNSHTTWSPLYKSPFFHHKLNRQFSTGLGMWKNESSWAWKSPARSWWRLGPDRWSDFATVLVLGYFPRRH